MLRTNLTAIRCCWCILLVSVLSLNLVFAVCINAVLVSFLLFIHVFVVVVVCMHLQTIISLLLFIYG